MIIYLMIVDAKLIISAVDLMSNQYAVEQIKVAKDKELSYIEKMLSEKQKE
jgi:hypothetical protein